MDGALGMRARPIVTLVGSDERLRRYRHPVPTAAAWKHVVMVALCAERDGLVVSLSRIVAAGGPPDLEGRTHATASVFGRLLEATRPGATAASLYTVAAAGYAAAGFPGEELKHHQGGAIGYRAREWVAHPASQETVQARQAFAWNPTIAGTKIEDTALVIDERIEMLTMTPDWPQIDVGTSDRAIRASNVWRL
jgi:antitoxin VapB